MVRLIEEYDLTRKERIQLIKDLIKRMENDDIDGIAEDIYDEYGSGDVTKDDAVLNGYRRYVISYCEKEEDGCDFVEKYYGSDIETFYDEAEQAVEEYVSTFSDDEMYSFFEEQDDPLNPGNMDHYINGSGYSYKPPRYDRW